MKMSVITYINTFSVIKKSLYNKFQDIIDLFRNWHYIYFPSVIFVNISMYRILYKDKK